MSWGETRRVDDTDGFMFLTPPWWFNALHLFSKKKQRGYASLAFIAYWMQHDPRHVPFTMKNGATKFMARLLVNWYPIYWLIASLRTLGKRLLGVAILLAILGIPFAAGLLVGMGVHISITIK